MPIRRALPLAVLAVLLPAPVASATVDLTAYRIRIGPHPAFVRVVVDFTDGTFGPNDVNLTTASGRAAIDRIGTSRIELRRRNAQAQAAAVSAHGIRASVVQLPGAAGLRLRLAARPRTFKFLGYTVLHNPERLVIDVFRRDARVPATHGACLSIRSTSSTPRRVDARGTVRRPLFENGFRVRLRAAAANVVSARSVIFPPGPWQATLRHGVRGPQQGLFEAVVFSAKDDALECLAQTPVPLVP
jgi:hypothetical protein